MSKNKLFFLCVIFVLFWTCIVKADEPTVINSSDNSTQPQATDVNASTISNEELAKQLSKANEEITDLKKNVKISELINLKDSNKKLKSDLNKSNAELSKANDELKRIRNALNTIDEQIAECKGTPRDPNKSYGVSSPKRDVIWAYPAKPHRKDD